MPRLPGRPKGSKNKAKRKKEITEAAAKRSKERRRTRRFTLRECQLMMFLVDSDLSMDEISDRLGLSHSAIAKYANDIYRAFGIGKGGNGRMSLMHKFRPRMGKWRFIPVTHERKRAEKAEEALPVIERMLQPADDDEENKNIRRKVPVKYGTGKHPSSSETRFREGPYGDATG